MSARKYQEAAVASRPTVIANRQTANADRPTVTAERAFQWSQTDADVVFQHLQLQSAASKDPTLGAFSIQARAILKMAAGLKDLSIALRQIYDKLEELNKICSKK